jgi:hypothetical protein
MGQVTLHNELAPARLSFVQQFNSGAMQQWGTMHASAQCEDLL